jgi:hypothetical protein
MSASLQNAQAVASAQLRSDRGLAHRRGRRVPRAAAAVSNGTDSGDMVCVEPPPSSHVDAGMLAAADALGVWDESRRDGTTANGEVR